MCRQSTLPPALITWALAIVAPDVKTTKSTVAQRHRPVDNLNIQTAHCIHIYRSYCSETPDFRVNSTLSLTEFVLHLEFGVTLAEIVFMLPMVLPGRAVVLSLLLAAGAVVSSGQLVPFSTSNYAAKVISQTGQVSVVKDTRPWALSIGDSVQVRDLILTGPDGHALLQVSDGSTFEVFPNSRVVFRKNPPNWKDFLDVLVGRV